MRSTPGFRAICARLRSFASNRDGNIAIIFGLSLVPLVSVMGFAIDYGRASSARSAVQAALDSTTLMLSKEAPNLTAALLQQKAHDYFTALMTRKDIQNVTVNPPVYTTTSGSQLSLSVNASVKTDFMNVLTRFGCTTCNQMSISGSSSVKWGNTRLRVALVLDNTGSMADDGKIGALQTATHNLLGSLQNAATKNGDVYVSIIPFSRDVNVDNTNYAASWIDWTSWDAQNTHQVSSTSCTTNKSGQQHCTTTTSTVPNDHTTWNGCVTDRGTSTGPSSNNSDTNNTVPTTSDTTTLFPAEQYGSCPSALLPLTYDWTGLSNEVNAMVPNGNTNQTIGLQWGWQSLSQTAPLNAPAFDTSDGIPTRQIIILLTDGLNTQNRWSSDQSTIDARTLAACTNIKAANILLYTVQVDTGGDPTSTMLQNCASPDSDSPQGPKFFLLTSASEVVTTFNQIGTSLSNLRVAK